MAQIQKGETFTDTAPDYEVTSTRLNNHVAGAVLLPGAITEQTAETVTALTDYALISDTSAGAALKKVLLSDLVPAGGVSATQSAEANRQSVHQYAVGGLSTGVYAVTLSPAATAYTAGMVVRFKADTANLGAVDINVNGLGVKNLFQNVSEELPADFIRASQVVEAVYDGTNFQVRSLPWKAYITADQLASSFALPASAQVSGSVLQQVATSTASMSTVAAATPGGTIPADDTIPASNEGTQLLSQAITASNSSNVLDIEVIVPVSNTTSEADMVASLLQDGTCVAVAMFKMANANPQNAQLVIRHRQTAGTTSASTFTVRVGTSTGTMTINGTGGARLFGGVSAARLIITERKA